MKQMVVLNEQHLTAQNWFLGPLLFLTYTNDLFDDLSSNVTLFANNKSLLFYYVWYKCICKWTEQWLEKVNIWVSQWKISFNPNRSKKDQEINFSRKLKKTTHCLLILNNSNVPQTSWGLFRCCISFARSKILYQEKCWSQSTKPSPDFIWITTISCTTKNLIILFIQNWPQSNATNAKLSQDLLAGYIQRTHIRS